MADGQCEAALVSEPDFLEELRWGRQVKGLRVLLPAAKPDVVGKLLAQAWSAKAPKSVLASMQGKG